MTRPLLLILMAVATIPQPVRAQEIADRIFINGSIWTGESQARAQALAIAGDKILAVGTNAKIRALASENTLVTDLQGKLVLPGFNDSHWHFSPRRSADLADASDVPAILRALKEYDATQPESSTGWLTGRGWGYAAFPDQIPHRKFLDAIYPTRPVFLTERDGHMGLANTAALELAGITRDTPDPKNGRIEHDSGGELTGELKETAVALVRKLIPPPTSEELYEGLKRLMDQAASYGLTSLQIASGLNAAEWAAFERVLAEDGLKTRFYIGVPMNPSVTDQQIDQFQELRRKFTGPLIKYGSAKGMLDGTVDARTAAMLEPYTIGGTGISNYTQPELNALVTRYDREGFQIMLHAIGDRAIRMALDAYEHAAKENGTSGRRHRIEHVEVPDPADLPRFRALGVIASTQPAFAEPDETTLKNYAPLLGAERSSRSNSFRQFDDAGAVQTFGSDFPVFSMDVIRGIHCAVNRTTVKGLPKGGWYPKGRITVETALRHFTRDAAFASFDEEMKGTLAPGKLADFVVISQDILKKPALDILKAKIVLTVMGGRETWKASGP